MHTYISTVRFIGCILSYTEFRLNSKAIRNGVCAGAIAKHGGLEGWTRGASKPLDDSLVATPFVVESYRRIPLPTVDNTEVLEGHRKPSLQIFRHVRVEFEFTAQYVGKQSGISFSCRVRNYNAFTITG